MGKSSSSSKKLKRSSKEDPSKLRSVKKKKTKRSKSKKIRRIKDSSSDESESDSSFYSSSSEDDYRREKKRRSKLSKKKKRSRKRYSSSSESDDEDDDNIRLLKKKKRSKRKDQRVVTKKKKKKRSRRDSSSSSTSSDEGSESDGMRITREKGRVKDASEEPDECWQVEDDVMTEKKNSKRLKSIVVVTYNYDERKEGVVDDESDENLIVDDQRDGEATLSSPAHDNRRIEYDDFEEFTNSETSKASHPDNCLKGDDLEAILKKRALENLKRFRGESQRNGTVSKEVSSVSEGETLQTESEKFEESQERLLLEQKLCVSEGDKDLEASQVENVKESGTGLADLPSQQSGDTVKVKAGPGISSCTTTKRKLIRPVLGQESVNLASRKEAAACQDAEAESINGKSRPESSLALATKNVGESIEPTKDSSTSPPHADTEALDENKGESQSEQRTNDESQYEKKTMTVMRGGEMVQVSYKVYIPKKTSSLGRRQLRR
ncbi:PREDICTED: transcriptional regulator ATRX homolog [Brassica oleracea var. oleracea]|uniref:transcriptional regulator ATRX homolog n=1 Tax=Brassica oleracea var. oleracea TaxID=109376 RepID=UPI0006A75693|nr:PREDICTED: transcriptional regulator ATRX homolog [Brassica oleracea var. oleracea]